MTKTEIREVTIGAITFTQGAVIASEGILGGKYVRLEPGTAKKYLKPGGSLTKTKDFRSREDQVGGIIFLATGESGKGGQ